MKSSASPSFPHSGEFFAPLPLLAVGMLVINDYWAKARFHNELTGKLSDVAVCFLMPLFCSELLGIVFGATPRMRLLLGSIFTALAFTLLEVVPSVTRFVIAGLTWLGPCIGVSRQFAMTEDWTDLFCLLLIPLAYLYGVARTEAPPSGCKCLIAAEAARDGVVAATDEQNSQ